MKILITNDDGINAEGLKHLVSWAKTIGEVTVVAPKTEQSGKSHSIEIHNSYEVKKVDYMDGVEAYSVDSTPADCVRIGIIALKRNYDLVISGINNGLNLGGDIIYSGTCGAAFEASRLHTKALAFSVDRSHFESAKQYANQVYDYITSNKMFEHTDILNVNFPKQVKGIKITKQGEPIYEDLFDQLEDDKMIAVLQYVYKESNQVEYDTNAVMNGYISITPLTIDRTNLQAYEKLLKI